MALTGTVLPAHPHPLPDEILSSWLVRIARANGRPLLPFTQDLLPQRALWEKDIDMWIQNSTLETFGKKIGQPVERILQLTLKTYSGVLYKNQRYTFVPSWILSRTPYDRLKGRMGVQCCPLCFKEDTIPYERKSWRFAFSVACSTHRRLLIDHCPKCKAHLDFYKRDLLSRKYVIETPIYMCWNCQYNLNKVKPSLCNEDVLNLQNLFLSVLSNKRDDSVRSVFVGSWHLINTLMRRQHHLAIPYGHVKVRYESLRACLAVKNVIRWTDKVK